MRAAIYPEREKRCVIEPYSYIVRLEDTLRSRQDIILDKLDLTMTVLGAIFEAHVHFYDGSQLSILEEVQSLLPDPPKVRGVLLTAS